MTKIATNSVAKLSVAFVTVAMLFTMATPSQAATMDELQAQIAALLAQIAQLEAQMGGGSTSCQDVPQQPLTIGSQGAGVTALQNNLIAAGEVIPAGATGYFGSQTQAALASWQAANGVSPAVGYYGPITKAAMEAACVTAGDTDTDTDTDTTTDDLEGAAGAVESTDLVSSLSNEEVGEGDDDVEVAGLEIEMDDGSDVELRAVRLAFSDEGTVNNDDDLDEYVDEVSIWFNGEEVARVDADEFNDDNSYTKTVSLDRGAIIRAEDTGELVVAISALSNIDDSSLDNGGDSWDVDFVNIRFRDAQDAIITETVTEDAVVFSFVDFATAADLELKISKGDDSINDRQTVDVDTSDDTDNVELASFEFEVEGDSDVYIDAMPIEFTSTGAGVGEIINSVELVVDGEVIGSETVSSTTATSREIDFDNLDWTIEGGETVELIVRVDVNDIDGAFSNGDTLTISMGEDETDDATFDAEDGDGEDLTDADKTGSASTDAHAFYSEGLHISYSDDTTSYKDTNGDTAGGEQGLYTIDVELTAFDGDMYIPFGATISSTTLDTDDGLAYSVEDSNGDAIALNAAGAASTTAAVSSTADTSGAYYVVEEGETETFTLSVTLTPTTDGYYRVQFNGVNYNVDAAAVADTLQTAAPAGDFETGLVNLDV